MAVFPLAAPHIGFVFEATKSCGWVPATVVFKATWMLVVTSVPIVPPVQFSRRSPTSAEELPAWTFKTCGVEVVQARGPPLTANFAINASMPPMPMGWNAPGVTGSPTDDCPLPVQPVMYAFPEESAAIPAATSFPLPPKYVAYTKLVNCLLNSATNASPPPLNVGCVAAYTGKSIELVDPAIKMLPEPPKAIE